MNIRVLILFTILLVLLSIFGYVKFFSHKTGTEQITKNTEYSSSSTTSTTILPNSQDTKPSTESKVYVNAPYPLLEKDTEGSEGKKLYHEKKYAEALNLLTKEMETLSSEEKTNHLLFIASSNYVLENYSEENKAINKFFEEFLGYDTISEKYSKTFTQMACFFIKDRKISQQDALMKNIFLKRPELPCLADIALVRAKEWYLNEQAKTLSVEENYLARRVLSLALNSGNISSEDIQRIKNSLTKINQELFYTPLPTPDSVIYTVKKGDTIGKIAKEYNSTVGLIKRVNNLTSNIIYPNKKLKVFNVSKFHIIINKTTLTLTLFYGVDFVKEYPVSVGGPGNLTPSGKFTIQAKVIEPPWRGIPYGDPRNILGTRWIGFAEPFTAYGIHGGATPEKIGKETTNGCIRMINQDVEELFDMVTKGTLVEIVP